MKWRGQSFADRQEVDGGAITPGTAFLSCYRMSAAKDVHTPPLPTRSVADARHHSLHASSQLCLSHKAPHSAHQGIGICTGRVAFLRPPLVQRFFARRRTNERSVCANKNPTAWVGWDIDIRLPDSRAGLVRRSEFYFLNVLHDFAVLVQTTRAGADGVDYV